MLLKNDGILPLHRDSARIHLTGPFVEEGDALLGTWVLDGSGADVVTPAAALRDAPRRADLDVATAGSATSALQHGPRRPT